MRALNVFIALTVVLLIGLNGCNWRNDKVDRTQTPINTQNPFDWIQSNIINTRCISCHLGSSAAFGVDLSSYETIMASNVIVPGRPDQSKFYTSILPNGTMPKDGGKLTAVQVKAVGDWIKAGAPKMVLKPGASPTPVPSPSPQPTAPPKPKVSYTWIYENIFKQRCIGCHQIKPGKKSAPGDVDLRTFDRMIDSSGTGMKPIVPGDPEHSGIYDQVVGDPPNMPPGPRKLSIDERNVIRDWILQGAKNN